MKRCVLLALTGLALVASYRCFEQTGHSLLPCSEDGDFSAFSSRNHAAHQTRKRRSVQDPLKYSDREPATGQPVGSLVAAGYLLAHRTELQLNMSSPLDTQLFDLLERDSPDMRPSRGYREHRNVSVELAQRAWTLMHVHAQAAIEQRIHLAWPVLNELLRSAHVTDKCSQALRATLEEATLMRAWAVKLLNSWGSFPFSAIFEGTYGDVGSFETCVNIKDQQEINHAHYCSVTFKPVLPTTKDYELIVRHEPNELVNTFEMINWLTEPGSNKKQRDAFSDLLDHAQYHHFVYYKWGTCWPIDCTPFDVRRVAKLVARRNIMLNGPVKCYSKNSTDYDQVYDEVLPVTIDTNIATTNTTKIKLKISVHDKNQGIFIWKPQFNLAHKIALGIVVSVATFIIMMSLVDFWINIWPGLWRKLIFSLRAMSLSGQDYATSANQNHEELFAEQLRTDTDPSLSLKVGFRIVPTREMSACIGEPKQLSTFMSVVKDCSLFTNVPHFFRVSEGQMKNEILCLNGIRCITMIWIIMTHTMLYNDWSAFGRTREVEKALKSLISQPLFNGSYLVDTFFLMSGLLSAFTTFRHCRGLWDNFHSIAFILSRWLRLTPQIFVVSMVYILFPILSSGPHWYPIVGEYSENCIENWWINVLHLQAFYKRDEMCNFVTWWISIDFFYHFLALAIIWIFLLAKHKTGFMAIALVVGTQVVWQAIDHYKLRLPPNVLSTIPQTGKMWTEMTLGFIWTPYTHSVPFFFGLYIGYLMAVKRKLIVRNLNTRRALIGWTLSIGLLLGQSYSTYWWVTGEASYSPLVSTLYYTICSIIWSSSMCWVIIACHHGFGGFINWILSWKVFIILGKASYLVYLTHFQILFLYFGNQNIFLEPTTLNMLYIILGNISLSSLWGVFLCSVFEFPWLKAQRRLMKYV